MPPSSALQLSEQLDFQRRAWRVQRSGWLALGLLVLAAALGLFGQGFLAEARHVRDGAYAIEYERYARRGLTTRLRVEVGATAIRDGGVEFAIGRAYLDGMRLERMQPQPQRVVALPDALQLRYDAVQAGRPLAFEFDLEPLRYGRHSVQLRLPDGSALELPQFVYP